MDDDSPDWVPHREQMCQRLVDGDAMGAEAVVTAVLGRGATPAAVYLQLFTPCLHRIGELWAEEEIDVGEEHRAAEIVSSLRARLSVRFRTGPGTRGMAVTTTPPGERHGLAAAMVADFVRSAGWTAQHLGADLPLDALRAICAQEHPDLICVSATLPLTADDLADLADAAAGTPMVVGGTGVPPLDGAVPDGVRILSDPLALKAELADASRGPHSAKR